MFLLCVVVLFVSYLFARLTLGITRSAKCLVGKTAIVTGANSGLGYQTALNLASRGCKVIMADVADMEESKNNIIKNTNNSDIITKKVDFSSFKSVREFASDILENVEKIDILVNNAGIGFCKENRTKDDLNPVMQINYFSHFLLTHLLKDLLKRSAPSRVVFTSSALAFVNNLTPDNLNFDGKARNYIEKIILYGNSKLAIIVATNIFAEKLKDTGVTFNSVHPGFVQTPIFTKLCAVEQNRILQFLLGLLLKFFSKDAWEGSQTIVHAAVSEDLEGVSGVFLSDCRHFVKPWSAYNKKFCEKIWEASEEIVELAHNEKLL